MFHYVYIAPYESVLEKLSVVYTPYCIWGVPAEAPSDIISIEDLAKPDIAAQFRKQVQGITPGAGISRFSRQIIQNCGLAEHGFHFENGTLDECTGTYLNAIAAGDLAVVPLWHPQWLHMETAMRELEDSKGLLGGQDEATLVSRKDAMHKLSTEGIHLLRNMSLGNATVSELDHAICRSGLSPRKAAREWIDKNGEIVSAWISQGNGKA